MIEILCHGTVAMDMEPDQQARWMQSKPVRQCVSKTENKVIGTITLAEHIGERQILAHVTITDKEACERLRQYEHFSIRSCTLGDKA
jgi:hypothetical protein